MKERPEKIEHEPEAAGPGTPGRDSMVELFVQLNTARKVGEFCSSDHPQCLRAVKRAVEIVGRLEEEAGELTFSAADGAVTAGGVRLEPGEPYLLDFAAALRSAGIAALRLAAAVSSDGLVRFIRLLAASSDPAVADGQARQFLDGLVAQGITVTRASPAAGSSTEPPADDRPELEAGGWEAEVRSRLGASPAEDQGAGKAGPADGDAGVALADINPRQLAKLINGFDFIGSVELIAGHFLVPYIRQAGTGQAGEKAAAAEHARARFLQLIRSLSPGHQIRFLTAVLETSHTFTDFAGAVLEAVPIHLAVQAFGGIRAEENTVHPQIISRYEALCRLTGWPTGETGAAAREKVEDGIEADGGEGVVLGASPADSPAGKHSPAPGPSLLGQKVHSAIADQFARSGKRKALIRVGLDLFERSASLDETRAYSGTLPGLFAEALEEEDWAGLGHSWAELTGLVGRGQKAKPFLSKALQRIQKSFLTLQAMELIVDGIQKSSGETRKVIHRWLPRLGSAAGEMLVLALIGASDRSQRHSLLSAIVAFGEDAIPMAMKRINDHRWYVVRNMISIVREVGDKRAGEDLLTLSGHVQFQVRRELINTLLALEHSAGLELAEQGIRGNDQKMRSACIGLLGSHRADGGRNILLRILEDKFRGGVPFSQSQKMSAVWALGQIGSSAVLPALHGLLKKIQVFKSPGSHELKMAILRSLPGYPCAKVEPLARWGVAHGDADEADICRRLISEIRTLPEGNNR